MQPMPSEAPWPTDVNGLVSELTFLIAGGSATFVGITLCARLFDFFLVLFAWQPVPAKTMLLQLSRPRQNLSLPASTVGRLTAQPVLAEDAMAWNSGGLSESILGTLSLFGKAGHIGFQ